MAEVAFTEMKAGTPADYQLLAELEKQHIASLPDRILNSLEAFMKTQIVADSILK